MNKIWKDNTVIESHKKNLLKILRKIRMKLHYLRNLSILATKSANFQCSDNEFTGFLIS